MATKYIDKVSSSAEVENRQNAGGIGILNGTLVYNNGSAVVPVNASEVVAVTAGATLSPATHGNRTVRIDAVAGGAFVLPAATGSGVKYKVVLGTALTSASVSVAAAGTDTFTGYSIQDDAGDTTPALAGVFPTVNGTTDTWTDAFTGGGGEIGNFFEAEDIKTGLWLVRGWQSGVLDPATPFSGS